MRFVFKILIPRTFSYSIDLNLRNMRAYLRKARKRCLLNNSTFIISELLSCLMVKPSVYEEFMHLNYYFFSGDGMQA